MKQFFIAVFLLHCLLSGTAQMNQLEIGLKNGQILYPELLKLKEPFLGQAHLVVNDSEKIKLEEVDYYQTSSEYFIVRPVGFVSNQPLRRIEAGRIAVYEYRRVVTTSNMGPNGMMMMGNQVKIDHYYQKGGDLERVNLNNLKRDLWDYPASRGKLKKAGNKRWVKIGLWVGGAAVLVAGLNQMAREANEGGPPYEEPRLNAPIVIGAGMIFAPFFIKNSQQENLLDAIRIYNVQ